MKLMGTGYIGIGGNKTEKSVSYTDLMFALALYCVHRVLLLRMIQKWILWTSILINLPCLSVCLSVCLSRYAFGHASTYGAETWQGGRVWRAGGNRQLFVVTRQVKGHPEVKSSRNALWLPNLVSRTPDHSVVHFWGQRSCRGHLGSARGQIA